MKGNKIPLRLIASGAAAVLLTAAIIIDGAGRHRHAHYFHIRRLCRGGGMHATALAHAGCISCLRAAFYSYGYGLWFNFKFI